MDALLQIIIPELKEVEGLSVVQPIYEFDGVEYPQGPRTLLWQDVSLSFDQETRWLNKFLPSKFFKPETRWLSKFLPSIFLKKDWLWLMVSDDTLDKYDISVRIHAEDEDDNERQLETFLRLLLAGQETWAIAFILHCDQIDSTYEVELEEAIAKLRSNLRVNSAPEGFIAFRL